MMLRTFHPSVTVAAVVCEAGRYLIVEEETAEGIRYNQPAGHLDAGESLVAAAIRETLEETAREFVPAGLLGVYLARSRSSYGANDVTYLRFAFVGEVGAAIAGRALDTGIVRALWLTADELEALAGQHRSPLVMRCVADHRRYQGADPADPRMGLANLDLLHADPSALHAPAPDVSPHAAGTHGS